MTVVPLHDDERDLQEAEAQIEDAERNAYYVRGTALARIRDRRLWRLRYNYSTFEEYCEERWELGRTQVFYLTIAAAFADRVHYSELPIPSRETHIRPLLTRLNNAHEDQIAVWRDVLATTNGVRIKAKDIDDAISRFLALRNKEYVTLDEWRDMPPAGRTAILSRIGKGKLNKQDNRDIEWADWSWNPVTGCLHGCPYCYARDIAFDIYPSEVGFGATIWPDRLTAPANQKPPESDDVAAKNIFTCSMADLFGRWVPDQWIKKVLSVAAENPQWNFLFLTKFPKRMAEFDIPENAWMGTTVDVQARVANAERAFENVKAPIRWLSIEPMIEPLKFSNLSLFDWVVIGGSSPSKSIDGTPATPAWNPPIEWIIDLHQQARAAGCKIYYKTNSGLSDMTRIREFPGRDEQAPAVPAVFSYLGNIPQKEQIG
jgi:protein gp37